MKRRFWTAIFVLAAPMLALAKPTVREFKKNASEHISRLQIAAIPVVRRNPQHFPNLIQREDMATILRRVMTYHDFVKVWDAQQLSQLGYSYRQDIATRLQSFWGSRVSEMPPKKRQDFEKLKNEFNSMEEQLKSELLRSMGIDAADPIVGEIKKLETVLDTADIVFFRRAEVGSDRPGDVVGAEFLRQNGFASEIVELAMKVESEYMEVLRLSTGRSEVQIPMGLPDCIGALASPALQLSF